MRILHAMGSVYQDTVIVTNTVYIISYTDIYTNPWVSHGMSIEGSTRTFPKGYIQILGYIICGWLKVNKHSNPHVYICIYIIHT